MLIAYDSKTGNVERFVSKLDGFRKIKIYNDLVVNEPFVLVTFTTGFGEIPLSTENFLELNYPNMIGVASSGNRNWGGNFAKAARIISEKYCIPNILEFELSGTHKDIEIFTERLREIETH